MRAVGVGGGSQIRGRGQWPVMVMPRWLASTQRVTSPAVTYYSHLRASDLNHFIFLKAAKHLSMTPSCTVGLR